MKRRDFRNRHHATRSGELHSNFRNFLCVSIRCRGTFGPCFISPRPRSDCVCRHAWVVDDNVQMRKGNPGPGRDSVAGEPMSRSDVQTYVVAQPTLPYSTIPQVTPQNTQDTCCWSVALAALPKADRLTGPQLSPAVWNPACPRWNSASRRWTPRDSATCPFCGSTAQMSHQTRLWNHWVFDGASLPLVSLTLAISQSVSVIGRLKLLDLVVPALSSTLQGGDT